MRGALAQLTNPLIIKYEGREYELREVFGSVFVKHEQCSVGDEKGKVVCSEPEFPFLDYMLSFYKFDDKILFEFRYKSIEINKRFYAPWTIDKVEI